MRGLDKGSTSTWIGYRKFAITYRIGVHLFGYLGVVGSNAAILIEVLDRNGETIESELRNKF
jgi:hypothetical protein